jgi:hypothetical protein
MLQGTAMLDIRNVVLRTLKQLVLAICVSISFPAASRANACAALSHTVPSERISALARGFNADGWLNGPQSTAPATPLLRELRAAGMTHVRLPVPAERLMRRFASSTEHDDLLFDIHRPAPRRPLQRAASRRRGRRDERNEAGLDRYGPAHSKLAGRSHFRRTAQ